MRGQDASLRDTYLPEPVLAVSGVNAGAGRLPEWHLPNRTSTGCEWCKCGGRTPPCVTPPVCHFRWATTSACCSRWRTQRTTSVLRTRPRSGSRGWQTSTSTCTTSIRSNASGCTSNRYSDEARCRKSRAVSGGSTTISGECGGESKNAAISFRSRFYEAAQAKLTYRQQPYNPNLTRR